MSLWSRLRQHLRPTPPPAAPPGGDASAPARPATISEHDPRAAAGRLTLTDGTTLPFQDGACLDFQPLCGARVLVLGVSAPDPGSPEPPRATHLQLQPESQSEYAALLRVHQVARSVGRADPSRGLPPWLRRRVPAAEGAGAKPKGRGEARPRDAYFVFTVLLTRPLPADPDILGALLDGGAGAPAVRLIPLHDARRGVPEPGFAAEIRRGAQRAFLVYRPEPYPPADVPPESDAAPQGHVGLFLGFHDPPAPAAEPGDAQAAAAAAFLQALAAALLRFDPASPGLVQNQHGRQLLPRAALLSEELSATPIGSTLIEP